MSKLQIGSQVRVVFPVNAQGRYLPCSRHLADAIDITGQVGEVMTVHEGDGHTVGVVFMTIWHGGSPWSDYFKPDELVPHT